MRANKTPWPVNKWDPTPGTVGYVAPPDSDADAHTDPAADPDDLIDEDDRPAAARPRHPDNKWEAG